VKPITEFPELEFYEAVVCEIRQPLTTAGGKIQLARRLLETHPARADAVLSEALSQIANVDRLLIAHRDRARDAAYAEALFKK
jgi:hypothetical protein